MFSDRTGWNLAQSKLSATLNAYRDSGKPFIDLTQSNPTECGFQYDSQQILAALNDSGSLIYEPIAQGLPVAREAVAEYYRSRGDQLDIADIFLTTGTSEAYAFLLRTLCNAGDEVLVPQPGYPLLNFLADIHDVTLRRYSLIYDYGWQIDFHTLRQNMSPRTRAIVPVHPNNPTGHFCKAREMARLGELCAEKGIAIIADEVFLDFALDGRIRESFVSNNQALTFTLSGLSKIAGLPQMKVAWLVAGGRKDLKDQAIGRLEMIADTYLSMSAPTQWGLKTLMRQRAGFQAQCLSRIKSNLQRLDELISSQKLCTRLELEGGWYAVLKVPVTGSDEELALELLESRGVYVHPGHFYDFPTDGHLVVSLITRQTEFAAGIAGLMELFREKYRQPTKDS